MMKNNYYRVSVICLKSKNMLLDQIVEHNECHIHEKNLRDREICVRRYRCRCRCKTYHIQEGSRGGFFFFLKCKKEIHKKVTYINAQS